ncbi:hypothetical protein K443DRAFT_679774 [Laccaria amethystina LaAM-08-1]|uniref:BTB domain-containing protein n=1 Tax=Laccaria amethystina LaAM-08-1 TaxID=1095629 RepID=A0A0C9XPU4_9AGAR|nr:hypothetical protein K443DRAFT_679774 [Laccaria amethystina LaAM-08-1]
MGEDRPIGPSKQPETPSTRHSKYYFDDQQSVFLVENTFFKVHRYYLTRESEVFRTMFSCPSSEHGQEGVDDSKPIHLPGVTTRQFEALLDFFYGGQLQRSIQVERPSSEAIPVTTNSAKKSSKGKKGIRTQLPSYEAKAQTAQSITFHATDVPQLFDLLSISTFYDFGLAREYAIRAIEANGGLDPIDKIYYANQCDIPEWLFTAYKELCQRSDPLEASEAERIGLTTAILVAKAREQIIRDQGCHRCVHRPMIWGSEEEEAGPVDAIVNSVFFDKEN